MNTINNHSETLRKKSKIILLIISFAQFIIALDYSIVYIALPSIAESFELSPAIGQWIVTSYGLLFAGFLLLGGRLSDRYGDGKVFIISTSAFGIASLLGGLSYNAELLLLSRGIQGLSAAAMQPAIISLISSHFKEGDERTKSLSIWGAVGASGLVMGVVFGGIFTEISWRIIFLINVPLIVVCIIFGKKYLKNHSIEKSSSIPVASSIIGTTMVLSLVLSMTLFAENQNPNLNILTFATAGLVLLFFLTEKHSNRPLIDRNIRSIPNLRIGCAASALYMAGVGTEFYAVTTSLQSLHGMSPLSTSVMFLPLSIFIIIGNILAGKLSSKYSSGKVLFWGFGTAFIGILLIAHTLDHKNWLFYFVAGLIVSGLGHGMIYTSKFALGIRGIPESQKGAASSLMVTSQYTSGAIALALLVIVLNSNDETEALSYQTGFVLLALFCIIGCVVSLFDDKLNVKDS
ncbi:MFS transporter [Halomonas sp. AOP13-D3-9]